MSLTLGDTHQVKESNIEDALLKKLQDLKYTWRRDIRDKATLEQNFREKFETFTLSNGISFESLVNGNRWRQRGLIDPVPNQGEGENDS